MAVPKAKNKKKKSEYAERLLKKERERQIVFTSAISLAVVLRTLETEFDFTEEKLQEFFEGYLGLYAEIGDGRVSSLKLIQDTNEMIGKDTLKMMKGVVKHG